MLGYIQDHTSIALCFITLHCLALHACLHAHQRNTCRSTHRQLLYLPTTCPAACLPPPKTTPTFFDLPTSLATYLPFLRLPTSLPACLPTLHWQVAFSSDFHAKIPGLHGNPRRIRRIQTPDPKLATNGVTRPERPKRSEDSLLRHSVTAPGCPGSLAAHIQLPEAFRKGCPKRFGVLRYSLSTPPRTAAVPTRD